jgi:peptidoglycan L-alanyl-D-glutamate endopeptidase CwlK
MRTLDQLAPRLRDGVPKILAAMAAIGYPMMVTDTLRTVEEQQVLFAKGRTAPGPIVTRADGVIKRSNHQPHGDGLGHAVDCCFVVDGHASWDPRLPWKAYGALAEALGFAWGGNWQSLHDLPHIELLEPATTERTLIA